jgi:hypothetical protein
MVRHLKLYEQFNNSGEYEIVNQLINDEIIVNKVMRVVNSLPNRFKNILKEFFSQKRIDVDKFYKIEKKFNVFEKVKNLYDKGVRNINEIIDRIFPKNESFLVGLLAIAIVAFVLITGIWGGIKITEWISNRGHDGLGTILGMLWGVLIIGGFFVFIYSYDSGEAPRKKLQGKEEELNKIILDTGIKEDTIMLVRDEDGNYKVDFIEKSNW